MDISAIQVLYKSVLTTYLHQSHTRLFPHLRHLECLHWKKQQKYLEWRKQIHNFLFKQTNLNIWANKQYVRLTAHVGRIQSASTSSTDHEPAHNSDRICCNLDISEGLRQQFSLRNPPPAFSKQRETETSIGNNQSGASTINRKLKYFMSTWVTVYSNPTSQQMVYSN